MKTIAIVGASLAGTRAFSAYRDMIERRAPWTEALQYAKDHG